MNFKLLERIIGVVVFLLSITVLFFTVQPSVSFWDCGEFIAAGYYLQVPHPPGTPFFLLLGRIFSMIPFADNIAFRVNTISVLTSALSVLFLYLIAVKLIVNYRGKEPKNLLDGLGTYIAAAIGALSFSFSDTFWFNGVEAEVYATSTFLLAAITYLMMLWNEKADNRDNEKYILMIAYLIGLSTAVHLMSVLAVIAVVMIIMFRKYVDDDESFKKTAYILMGHTAVILILAFALWGGQTSSNPPSPEEYESFDSRFKLIVVGISVLIMGAFWKKLFTRNSIYLQLIIGGIALFITYPGMVKILPGIMSSVAGNNLVTEILFIIVLFAAFGYGVYYSVKNNKPTLHLVSLSLVFVFLGFATYTMVIVRSNQQTPMNENEPNDFTELVSYLNREQYGDFPTFKRRFATEPHQMGVYSNYSSDLDFWWRYQMNHMMTRYLLWNYVGRESWNQDSGVNMAPLNGLGNALGKIFNVRFGGDAKDSLFGIPFLLGLLGIYFHFRRDWKMASTFMMLFIFMGYLTAFYQNQQQPQPRERDYFYVGAFFVYSIWIAIAIRGLIDLLQKRLSSEMAQKAAIYGVLLFGIVFVPVRMLQANYFTHDRSKNWVPWDYSYNLLQSCAPNAILFTNGDNDTFPLWYLQDVEGVRRDIRIANLSLINTPWYIKQLKNTAPYGTPPIRIRMSDQQIEEIRPIQWTPQNITIPAPGQNLLSSPDFKFYGVQDSSIIRAGSLTFRMNNTIDYGEIKAVRVQDLMVKEIVEANNWERPIYFAVTCSEDSKIGLSEYLKMEGMAHRLVPEQRQAGTEFINEKVMRAQLFDENPGYSRDYKPGFKFRGLNDKSIFFDDNHERLTQNYRNSFIRLALHYINYGNHKEKCIETLNEMDRKIPRSVIPIDHRILFDIAGLYLAADAKDKYKELARDVEKVALQAIDDDPTNVSSQYSPYRLLIDIYENLGEYDKAINILTRLLNYYPNDSSVIGLLDHFKSLKSAKEAPVKK